MTIIKKWGIIRIFRLVLGILVIYEATHQNTFFLYFIGLFLTLHALFNVKCGITNCEESACSVVEKKDGISND